MCAWAATALLEHPAARERTNESIFLIISPRFCTCGLKKVAARRSF